MQISGIRPFYQFKEGGTLREAFDYQLNKYLAESAEPFTECAECGDNIFRFDKAVKRSDGKYICLGCCEVVDTDTIEPERLLP